MTTAMPRVGHLFAGYDGIGMAVEAIWPDSQIAWVSDVCKFNKDGTVGHHEPHRAPCSILAHHYPDVPNIGDVTTVNWAKVEPVDILTGGSPCQDLSHAGKRAGMTEGTRSNLWVAMREAIAQLRPSIVIWENVRGAYTAEADSDLVTNPRLLADTRRRDGQPLLRALGRVLGDLSELGYVGGWHGLRAADVGAPHGRFRVFVVAYPSSNERRLEHRDGAAVANTISGGRNGWSPFTRGSTVGGAVAQRSGESSLLPTPTGSDTNGAGAHGDGGLDLRTAVVGLADDQLLGTPTSRMWKGSGPVGSKSHDWLMAHGSEAQVLSLLPTPRAGDGEKGGPNQRGSSGDLMLPSAVQSLLPTPRAFGQRTSRHAATTAYRRSAPSLEQAVEIAEGITPREIKDGSDVQESWSRQWGQYAAAIARWEKTVGPAPAPTQLGAKGNPQLAAAFSEWMMGLPAGWVTDVPGIRRNEALKALGNGVVPQQAEAAIRFLLHAIERAA